MIDFPTLSLPNARRWHTFTGLSTLQALRQRIDAIEWFSKLGEPSRWDAGAHRLSGFDVWPGPEHPGVLALALEHQAIHDSIIRHLDGGTPRLEVIFQGFHDRVHARAQNCVPFFDPNNDSWHGPTQCVWDAAYCTGLIACFLEMSWRLPDDLHELWAWFEAGHWPCGYAADPELGPQALLVL